MALIIVISTRDFQIGWNVLPLSLGERESKKWPLGLCDFYHNYKNVRTLREDQPLRLLLNLLFFHFNRSEPTYKSHRIKLPHVIAACHQLNVNALN